MQIDLHPVELVNRCAGAPRSESTSMEMHAEETRPSIIHASCGVCLSEGGGATIRGVIDCCDHFFCYVCILEWAKVESRCPLCKRRFSTICRPPKPPLFPSERIVKVPHRDQVYLHSGNATTSRTNDPYGDVKCSVCYGTGDDYFLLLCDLCDSAAHTYCVGLGKTVPEGDWFCSDCSVSREEHKQTEVDAKSEEENASVDPQPDGNVDILEIVAESKLPFSVHAGCKRNITFLQSPLLSSAVPGTGCNSTNQAASFETRCERVVGQPSLSAARTMHVRRNVQSRIQALRENWDALRNGSLSFSACSTIPCCEYNKRRKVISGFHGASDNLQTSSSELQQSTAGALGFCDNTSNDGFCNISKAWKMMDLAKSIQQNPRRNSITNQTCPHYKNDYVKKTADIGSGLRIATSQLLESSNRANMGEKMKNDGHHHNETRRLEKRKGAVDVGSTSAVLAASSFDVCESSSTKAVKFPTDANIMKGIRPGLKYSGWASSCTMKNNPNKSVGLDSLPRSIHQGSGCTSDAEAGLVASLSSCTDLSAEKCGLSYACAKGNPKREDDAKKEIQSLVKLNLKLLSNGKQLGADVFKTIARLATHTTLAACRLDHSESCIIQFPNSLLCSHSKQRHKSTLMPNTCRECFCVFVKDVVSFLVHEKVSLADCSRTKMRKNESL